MENFEKQFIQFLEDDNDQAAFAMLYDRYWEKVFFYVVKVLQNKEDAIDVVQETFVAFWEQREHLPNVAALNAYLFAIARYKSLLCIRKHIHRRDYLNSLTAFFNQYEQSPEELMIGDELQDVIAGEVQRLPAKMRAIFTMSRQENLSHKEIAAKLHISDKTVKKQISNSLKLLRLKINNHYLRLLFLFLINP